MNKIALNTSKEKWNGCFYLPSMCYLMVMLVEMLHCYFIAVFQNTE